MRKNKGRRAAWALSLRGTVLYQTLAAHLPAALAEATRRGGGQGLPRFVE